MGGHKKIETTPEEKPKESEKKKINLRLVGNEGNIIPFEDFKNLTTSMHNCGWDLIFEKTKTDGWWVEFRRQQ